jgi:hypothetical protein
VSNDLFFNGANLLAVQTMAGIVCMIMIWSPYYIN